MKNQGFKAPICGRPTIYGEARGNPPHEPSTHGHNLVGTFADGHEFAQNPIVSLAKDQIWKCEKIQGLFCKFPNFLGLNWNFF